MNKEGGNEREVKEKKIKLEKERGYVRRDGRRDEKEKRE